MSLALTAAVSYFLGTKFVCLREIIERGRWRLAWTLQIHLYFVQQDGECHSKGADRGQGPPLHSWWYLRENWELNFNCEIFQDKIKRSTSPRTVNLGCCGRPGQYCSLRPWTTTCFPPGKNRDMTESVLSLSLLAVISCQLLPAALPFSLSLVLLQWWMCRWGLHSLSTPYFAFSLPSQFGDTRNGSSADKHPAPRTNEKRQTPQLTQQRERDIHFLARPARRMCYALNFCTDGEIHSIIQNLCLSLLSLPFSIIFLLVTEFYSRQVTYGSRLSQEGTCSEYVTQTMREFERGAGAGQGRRAENCSNKEKRPPEIQSKYFRSVSAAVSENSVKERIFVLWLVTWKINREQEQEAKCSNWFIWMR